MSRRRSQVRRALAKPPAPAVRVPITPEPEGKQYVIGYYCPRSGGTFEMLEDVDPDEGPEHAGCGWYVTLFEAEEKAARPDGESRFPKGFWIEGEA